MRGPTQRSDPDLLIPEGQGEEESFPPGSFFVAVRPTVAPLTLSLMLVLLLSLEHEFSIPYPYAFCQERLPGQPALPQGWPGGMWFEQKAQRPIFVLIIT